MTAKMGVSPQESRTDPSLGKSLTASWPTQGGIRRSFHLEIGFMSEVPKRWRATRSPARICTVRNLFRKLAGAKDVLAKLWKACHCNYLVVLQS